MHILGVNLTFSQLGVGVEITCS